MSRRKTRSDDGAAALEFALVVPLLVAFLFGIITYGYLFSVRQAVTQAAAEGARAGAVEPASGDPVAAAKAAIDRSLEPYGAKCGDGVNCDQITKGSCGGGSTALCVTVKVIFDYEGHDPIDLLPTPSTLTFTSSAEVN